MAYSSQLTNLIGSEVRINRGSADSEAGELLAVQTDYLVLNTKDGTVYLNGIYIKSVSSASNPKSSLSGTAPRFISPANFVSLLQKLRHQFVQINRGYPEKIEGFIAESQQDYIVMVIIRELVRVPVYYIRNISVSNKSSGFAGNSGNRSAADNKSNKKR